MSLGARCESCGVRGPTADDFEGMCEACYNERNADWFDEPEAMSADHCGACLEMVPGWSISNGEEPTCPHCGADPLVLITWRQMRERHEAVEREITAATTDGLIRWGK